MFPNTITRFVKQLYTEQKWKLYTYILAKKYLFILFMYIYYLGITLG